ncbi:MAG TPA: hypothetical protein VH063_08250 [Gaiellaceae bacterium]|nr:hypothetical protein [Gaiellaceae bacterium]
MFEDVDPRTAAEASFLQALYVCRPDLDVWPRGTESEPWLCVSSDFIYQGRVCDTLRLDFDGTSIAGGWSLYFLNGDDGVRAHDAGVDTRPPDGIEVEDGSPSDLARTASEWFKRHSMEYWTSERHARHHRQGLPDVVVGDPNGVWYATVRRVIRDTSRDRERLRLWQGNDDEGIAVEWLGQAGHPSSYGLLGGRIPQGARLHGPQSLGPWSRSLAGTADEVEFGLPDEYSGAAREGLGEGVELTVAAYARIGSSQQVFRRLAGCLTDLIPKIPSDDEALWAAWDSQA